MSYLRPARSETNLTQARFVGFYPELCFAPSWLIRRPGGYAALPAKDLGDRSELAHRLSIALTVGELQPGDRVLHRCGNSRCHNPHHLYVGNDSQNRDDKVLHAHAGRGSGPFGMSFQVGDHQVDMPQPLALSENICRLQRRFAGFTPSQCFQADWLHPTVDGRRQLRPSAHHGAVVGAERKMYWLFCGPLAKLDIVAHTCGDATCLNPFHLVVVGQHASERDFDCEHDKRFKLTESNLDLIATSTLSATDLARQLGVHRQTVVTLRADRRRR